MASRATRPERSCAAARFVPMLRLQRASLAGARRSAGQQWGTRNAFAAYILGARGARHLERELPTSAAR